MDAHVAHAVLASQLQGIIPQACEMAVLVCMVESFPGQGFVHNFDIDCTASSVYRYMAGRQVTSAAQYSFQRRQSLACKCLLHVDVATLCSLSGSQWLTLGIASDPEKQKASL